MEKSTFEWRNLIEIVVLIVLLFILGSKIVEAADSCGGWSDGQVSGEAWHNFNPGYDTESYANALEQDKCIQYVEERSGIAWNLDAKSKDDPDDKKLGDQLLEGGGIGANYYKSKNNLDDSGYFCSCEECTKGNNGQAQFKTDATPIGWQYTGAERLLMPKSNPDDVWNYVEGSDEQAAIFLCVNDTVDAVLDENGEPKKDNDGNIQYEQGEKMRNVIEYYKGQVDKKNETGGFYPAYKRLRELKVEFDVEGSDHTEDKRELRPGEGFTVYVKGLNEDNVDTFKDAWESVGGFKWENCKPVGNWEEVSRHNEKWFKRKAVVAQGEDLKENKVRITASYNYVNYYAIEYRFVRKFLTHTNEVRTDGSIQLIDPFEGSQYVHRDIAIEIPLRCNVKINQYISKIDGQANPDYIQKNGSNWQLQTRL